MKIPFFPPPPPSLTPPRLPPPPTGVPLPPGAASAARGARLAGPQSPLRRPALLNLVRLIRATPQMRDHARLLAAARTIARQRGDPARAAAAESGDPFVQFTLLALAAGDADGEGGTGGRRGRQDSHDSHDSQDAWGQGADALFEAALTRLDAQDPSLRTRVHAMNAALQSPDMLTDAARCDDALDAYVALVFQGDTLAALFEMLLARFGERFETMRGWLMATLSAELQSGWLSREPAQMAAVRQRLYDAQTLGTLVVNARALLARLRRAGRDARCTDAAGTVPQDALELSGEIVRLCARAWPGATRFAELGRRHGAFDLAAGLLWYAGLRQMLQALPVAVFAGAAPRQRLLDDIEQQHDRLAREEDEQAQEKDDRVRSAVVSGTASAASAPSRMRARR
ncbi:MAG: TyeA family type III secretion system gatekeeper subunit [Janthinobacterium lividum]